jgi:hypothetical protein
MINPAVPPHYGPRQAQPLERLLQSINLDELRPQAPPPSPEDILAMRAAAAIFSTPDGAVLLEWLADRTVRMPSALPPIGIDPVQGWAEAQRREGRNDTFFLLVQLIAAAREEPAPIREGSPS